MVHYWQLAQWASKLLTLETGRYYDQQSVLFNLLTLCNRIQCSFIHFHFACVQVQYIVKRKCTLHLGISTPFSQQLAVNSSNIYVNLPYCYYEIN